MYLINKDLSLIVMIIQTAVAAFRSLKQRLQYAE